MRRSGQARHVVGRIVSEREYGSTFAGVSPGRNPSRSPASTAGPPLIRPSLSRRSPAAPRAVPDRSCRLHGGVRGRRRAAPRRVDVTLADSPSSARWSCHGGAGRTSSMTSREPWAWPGAADHGVHGARARYSCPPSTSSASSSTTARACTTSVFFLDRDRCSRSRISNAKPVAKSAIRHPVAEHSWQQHRWKREKTPAPRPV